ncbi:MAG: hypothetical protein HPY74_07085 [Firmicutes bacterium]|nr:hypothetical protein [Bacillota bacterium]
MSENCFEEKIFEAICPQKLPEEFEVFIDRGNNYISLSTWGFIFWNKFGKKYLGKKLYNLPHLKYLDSFKKDFEKAEPVQRTDLQQRLAFVSGIILNEGMPSLQKHTGINFSPLTSVKTSDREPIWHFRLNDGRRVTCEMRGNELLLRRFGEHEVDDNP